MDPLSFYRELPTLETPRLVLRKLRREDAAGYFAFAGDPKVTQYLRWGPHPSLQHSADYLEEILQNYALGRDGPWGIEIAESGDLTGTLHLMEIDPINARADVGIVLGRRYWRQGLGSEALARVLEYSFTALGLHRVQAFVITANTAGRKLMEKCGMAREGRLRDYCRQKGTYQTFDLYASLAGDPRGGGPQQ